LWYTGVWFCLTTKQKTKKTSLLSINAPDCVPSEFFMAFPRESWYNSYEMKETFDRAKRAATDRRVCDCYFCDKTKPLAECRKLDRDRFICSACKKWLEDSLQATLYKKAA